MANLEKMVKGAAIVAVGAGAYWLYSKGYTQGQIDNIVDMAVSIPNYIFPRLNLTGLEVFNAIGLCSSAVGSYKVIKGITEPETSTNA